MMKSIMKITLMSVALAIPVISEAASGKTPTQRLADSFLCKGVITKAQMGKIIEELKLSEKGCHQMCGTILMKKSLL